MNCGAISCFTEQSCVQATNYTSTIYQQSHSKSTSTSLGYGTPLRYLPLVYILPRALLPRCPTLRKLPRRMGVFNDPEWQEVLGSQQFLNEIMDAMAALVFPHFGFGG